MHYTIWKPLFGLISWHLFHLTSFWVKFRIILKPWLFSNCFEFSGWIEWYSIWQLLMILRIQFSFLSWCFSYCFTSISLLVSGFGSASLTKNGFQFPFQCPQAQSMALNMVHMDVHLQYILVMATTILIYRGIVYMVMIFTLWLGTPNLYLLSTTRYKCC